MEREKFYKLSPREQADFLLARIVERADSIDSVVVPLGVFMSASAEMVKIAFPYGNKVVKAGSHSGHKNRYVLISSTSRLGIPGFD